jgi:hypothetical protein
VFIEGVENYETHMAPSAIAFTETIALLFITKDVSKRLCKRNSNISKGKRGSGRKNLCHKRVGV